MNLFCSVEHLESWLAANPGQQGDALDLRQTYDLGREWWGPLVDEASPDLRAEAPGSPGG